MREKGWGKKGSEGMERAWGRRETNGGESKSLLAHADLTLGDV